MSTWPMSWRSMKELLSTRPHGRATRDIVVATATAASIGAERSDGYPVDDSEHHQPKWLCSCWSNYSEEVEGLALCRTGGGFG